MAATIVFGDQANVHPQSLAACPVVVR